jgi:hypothetical protein
MGHIYFIRNENDHYIKIGYTERRVEERFREWRRSTPHIITLLGMFEGSREEEGYLKRIRFYGLMVVPEGMISSEWFEPDESILKYIEEKCVK